MPEVGIVGSGVATLDIYVKQKRMYPGGNEYNVVCNAKKLGARAGFIGVFGNDKAGEILEETLVKEGVEVQMSHHEIGSSGYSLVELKEDGDRIFLMWNKQGVTDLHPVQFTKEEVEYIRGFDVLTLGKLADVSLEKIKELADQGITISYDFNSTFTQQEVHAVAPYIRYGFFSCSHLKVEDIKTVLRDAVAFGCRLAIGTRGSDPVIAYDGARFYEQPTCKVEVKDALGAGDSYIGAFLVNYLTLMKEDILGSQERMRLALAKATEHSAQVIQMEGSIGVGYDVDPDKVAEIVNLDQK